MKVAILYDVNKFTGCVFFSLYAFWEDSVPRNTLSGVCIHPEAVMLKKHFEME